MNPLFAALTARDPDETVIWSDDHELSVQQLLTAVERLHTMLHSMGIDRLGLLADNSVAWITTDLACQSSGTCLLPMPDFFSDAQLKHSLQTAGIEAVLTDDPQRILQIVGADHASLMEADPDVTGGLTLLRLNNIQQQALPAGTQKITFTSGSTGTPRGVCLGIAHQLGVAEALQTTLSITAPRHVCLLPLSTLLENIGGVYHALLAGGTVFAPSKTARGFSGSTGLDMPDMLQTLTRHRPTSIILLPQMLVGLVAALGNGWQLPAELQFAAVGGAKVSATLIQRARKLGLPVYEGYGLSETASVACLNHPGHNRTGSVGLPLPHADVRIDAGEIIIRGNTFLGYADQPESWGLNAVATGDIGELDADGYLHLSGRCKNVLISSLGRNISPEWVESEVLVHPQIAQCIVFGDARPYCTALIAGSRSEISNAEIQGLLDNINANLPDYARIQKWHRLPQALTAAEGLYTDNGRPKRTLIARQFSPALESLYSDTSAIRTNTSTGNDPLPASNLQS